MKDFRGKVAVITGGASGIGRAMAERFAAEGMKIVIADIEQSMLDKTSEEIRAKNADVMAIRVDVSKADEMDALCIKAYEAFGKVHVLCNNAGVGIAGLSWQHSLHDWEWVMGVNLWGVIHGIRLFVPKMLAQNEEGHVINTASMAGLISGPTTAIYGVTKHAVVTLSETLHHEFKLTQSKLRCSVLCPAWVKTGIAESERNRPEALTVAPAKQLKSPIGEATREMVKKLIGVGLTPEQVAERVFEAVRDEKFYILTHPEWKDRIKVRMEDILAEREPTYVPVA